MPVGIFDSGLGGLTVLEAAKKRLPDQAFVYYGDSENAPYGSKSKDEIYDLTIKGVKTLFRNGCDLVILACNTASAVALHDLQVNWLEGDRRVLGVFVPMIEELTRRDWGDNTPPTHTGLHDVALFATPATVSSGAFERELKFRARDVKVVSQACVGLVNAIESGDTVGAETLVKSHVNTVLEQLPEPQAAILGCTHFPLMEDTFRATLPSSTRLVSQPEVVADSLADYLQRHSRFVEKGDVKYLTSGNPSETGKMAEVFLGRRLQFSSV